jgi:Na+-transporting NADH:ubiquinone oxidoreductase subunit F
MMQEVLLSVFFFNLLIIFLILLIFLAKKFLIGDAVSIITLNKDKIFQVESGEKLLDALANNQIFVSSACGGGGTCGQCVLKVFSGGGDVLPVERDHLSKKDIKEFKRLSCQVSCKGNLAVEVDAHVFGIKKWKCKVISNKNVATFIKELVLALPPEESINFRAGGYIQIEAPAHTVHYKDFNIEEQFKSDWEKYHFFDLVSKVESPTIRAYSMANFPLENTIIMLNVRIATPTGNVPPGKMSSFLFSLKPGDVVDVSGPYGEFFAKDTNKEMIFIGGGAGMAPMRSHLFDQLKRINTQRKISFWYGARSKKEIFYQQDFDTLAKEHKNFSWNIALSNALPEDQWKGYIGFIHQVLLEQYLKNHPSPEECEYYLCGPPAMNKAVVDMLLSLGVESNSIALDDFGG